MEPNETACAIEPAETPVVCPGCGAAFPESAVRCWLCGWQLGDPAPASAKRRPDGGLTFGIGTLLLTTALVGSVMSVARVAPIAATAIGIVSFPAWLYTFSVAARQKRKTGRRMPVYEVLLCFVQSFTAAVLIGTLVLVGVSPIISLVFFLASLVAPGPDNTNLLIGCFAVVAVIVAAAAFLVIRFVWQGE